MANITAAQVKELRERTGAGMMECKQALQEANGSIEEAEIVIAKSGHKKAAKKADRTAAEGLVIIKLSADKKQAAILEINCETDFVAKDVNFTGFCDHVAEKVLTSSIDNIEQLLASGIEEDRKNIIAKIGENVQVRRAVHYKVDNHILGAYTHHGSKIAVLVEISGGNETLARELAMHIASSRPKYLKSEEVPEKEVALQKEIFMAQVESSGKPEAIREKIVQGMLAKYFNEICVLGQPFFKDPDKTVGVILKDNGAEIKRYTRFEVGEGIEVKKVSFQDEVMAQLQGSPK